MRKPSWGPCHRATQRPGLGTCPPLTAARSPQPAHLPPTLGPPGPGMRGEPCSPHARACTSHRRRKAGLLPAACPARQRGPILLPLRSADARHTPVPGAGRQRSQHELTRGGFRHHPLGRGDGATGPRRWDRTRRPEPRPLLPRQARRADAPPEVSAAAAIGRCLGGPALPASTGKGQGRGRCPEAELPPSPHPQPKWGSPGTQAREGWCSPPST